MKLKPFSEMVGKTKEVVDAALAPLRARQVKAQAEVEMAKLEEKILTLETEIQELCVGKTIDFEKLLNKLDEVALIERRTKQYKRVVSELFPE